MPFPGDRLLEEQPRELSELHISVLGEYCETLVHDRIEQWSDFLPA